MNSQKKHHKFLGLMLAGCLFGSVFTGCQVEIGGQTLPSAYYLLDDVQYYTKGPEFKLSQEANALKEARGEERRNR